MTQREAIAAFAQQHGAAWLGVVNLYDDNRAKPVIWKWNGELVHNFEARFVIPRFDEELYELIILRKYAAYNIKDDVQRVEAIFKRIAQLLGITLFWN